MKWKEYNKELPPEWGNYRIRRKNNNDTAAYYYLGDHNGKHLSEQLGEDFEWLDEKSNSEPNDKRSDATTAK